jgi:hypothetical protein
VSMISLLIPELLPTEFIRDASFIRFTEIFVNLSTDLASSCGMALFLRKIITILVAFIMNY